MQSDGPMESRLRIAGTILIIGLLIEAACLLWAKPIAFVLFVAIGGLFLFAGLVVYLLSLVSHTIETPSKTFE